MTKSDSLFPFLRRRPKYALVACDGSPNCQAIRHLHGCYSDNGRNCDHPSEHLRGQLRRFGNG